MRTMRLRGSIYLALVLMQTLFWSSAAQAVTCTSQGNGNWTVPGTWIGCAAGNGTPGGTPGTNDTAVIRNADTVTVDATINVGSITVNGTLTPLTNAVINGAGTIGGNGTVRVTRITAGSADFNSQYSVTTKNLPNLTVEYAGTAAQVVNALTFGRLAINNANGVTLGGNTTVTTLLTLTAGNIATGASTLITSANCAGSVTRTTGHIVGNLRKRIPNNASTCIFEIGSGANYTPVVLAFVAGTTAGSITASTTGTDHGSLATSGIDPGKSVNRFWTLANVGVVLPTAGFSASFNFINGSPVDFDAGAVPANFIVQQWDGTNWYPTTLNPTCTPTPAANGCERVNGLTAFGDFAIGEGQAGFNSANGFFNVYETSTPAGAVLGRIHTKQANTPITLDVVALNFLQRNAITTNFNQVPITIELLDTGDNSGPLNATTNCRSSWSKPPLFTQSFSPTWSSGRATIQNIPALNTVARDVRVRVTYIIGNLTFQGCSTDRFAIRPNSLAVSASHDDWVTAGTAMALGNMSATGGEVHKAGWPFTLTASAYNSAVNPAIMSQYAGTANLVLSTASTAGCTGTACVGSPGMIEISDVPATTVSFSGGTFASNSVTYLEAGATTLQLQDTSFASVDSGDTPATCLGYYICSSAIVVGRFVPDSFTVSADASSNAARFRTFNAADNTCSTTTNPRSFTYLGQPFGYLSTAKPVFSIAAKNAKGGTTANYSGPNWHLFTPAGVTKKCDLNTCSFTSPTDAAPTVRTDYSYVATPASSPGWSDAATIPDLPLITASTTAPGTGVITYSVGDILAFNRSLTTPIAKFYAAIAVTPQVTDYSESAGPIKTVSPVATAVTFDSGAEFRYGRLKLGNAMGSELLNLQIPIEAQYWNGTGFVTNTQDNCTAISANNLSLTSYVGGINATNMPQSGLVTGAAFVGGVGSLRLNKPSPAPANKGSVNLCVDLGPDPAPSCAAPASANMPWLQGRWGAPASFDDDPVARATFGVYRNAPIIYMRELY
jgi:hypothetical protein